MELECMIEENGHEVVGIADDLATALDLAETENPDLAFVDMRLASNDNGLDVARMLGGKGIKVFFATGNCPGTNGEGLAIGCMHKPVVDRTLAASIAIAEQLIRSDEKPRVDLPPSVHLY